MCVHRHRRQRCHDSHIGHNLCDIRNYSLSLLKILCWNIPEKRKEPREANQTLSSNQTNRPNSEISKLGQDVSVTSLWPMTRTLSYWDCNSTSNSLSPLNCAKVKLQSGSPLWFLPPIRQTPIEFLFDTWPSSSTWTPQRVMSLPSSIVPSRFIILW